MNRRNIIILISILTFIIIIGGVSYSYFVYNKDVASVSLTAGDISMELSGVNGNQIFSNMIPLSDYDGKTSSSYFDFTVNATVDTERIYYEVYLLPGNNNTLDTRYLKTYLTDQNDVSIKGITIFDDLGDSEIENGKVIYKGIVEINNNGTVKNESKDFRLRLWLDESYVAQGAKTFNFDIYLYAKNVDSEYELPYGHNLVKQGILAKVNATTNSCNPTWTDTEDNIEYFSGDNSCVDMNYVWYSGKLWRITSIYPDGTMKLVTKNNMTSIAFNVANNPNFYTSINSTSYAYQWLNEDFYDTLYYPTNFIDNTKQWNATRTTSFTDKPSTTTLVTANVGLLNSYEALSAFRCVGSDDCNGTGMDTTGYLNNTYYNILLSPQDSSTIWTIFNGGRGSFNANSKFGIRPAIYMRNDVEFTGSGTINDPYKVVGDKRVGKANELINTRLSGEFVKLKNGNNELIFRIVSFEDDNTKIISMDYAPTETRYPIATNANDVLWGSGTTTDSGTWYTYLNSTYYPNLVSTYGGLFTNGTYYMGIGGINYKLAICANTTSGSTKVCTKTSDNGSFNVGLLRYGELFATQLPATTPIGIWLISRDTSTKIWGVSQASSAISSAANGTGGARPALYLKSTVKILSGSGTESDPYVVGL